MSSSVVEECAEEKESRLVIVGLEWKWDDDDDAEDGEVNGVERENEGEGEGVREVEVYEDMLTSIVQAWGLALPMSRGRCWSSPSGGYKAL